MSDVQRPARTFFSIALIMVGMGCVDSGPDLDTTSQDLFSARDTHGSDAKIDSKGQDDAAEDTGTHDLPDIAREIDIGDIPNDMGFQPCGFDVLECGPNQTCLIGNDSQPFCDCLPPYVWWNNIELPDAPEEGARYPLRTDSICLQQMPDEYFDDFPSMWWDEYGELYGYPDEIVAIEPVLINYDAEKGVLKFGADETEFIVREDSIAIRLLTIDNKTSGWAYLLKITKTRVVYYTFDWPSGKLTNIWPLVLR